MLLYILRHGDAELASIGSGDAKRTLTPKGERQAERAGTALRVIGVLPDLILTSPLPRARQTAEIVIDAIDDKGERPPVQVLDQLAPGANVGDVISAIPVDVTSVMLVGHQPTLGSVVGTLIGGMHAAPIDMQEASLACLETVGAPFPGAAYLKYFLSRHVIFLLKKAG